MELVIVGSAGYDDIETPVGKVSGLLGGSAIYSGLSAAFHARDIGLQRLSVGIVSIVGEDFDPDSERKLRQSGLDLGGLKRSMLPTFRWSGRYEGSMDNAETVSTELNSLADFNPDFPSDWKNSEIVFCSSASPKSQNSVLDANQGAFVTALDTFALWIEEDFHGLSEALRKVDIAIFNEDEVNRIGDDSNYMVSAEKIMSGESLDGGGLVGSGPDCLIVKRGSAGCVCIHRDGVITLPAYPVPKIVDPTGCGDVFAGAFLAQLVPLKGRIADIESIRRALVHATVTASFNIESFGTDAIANLKRGKYRARLDKFRRMVGII